VDLVSRLRAAGCVFAEDEAALLIAHEPDAVAREALVARRVAGEPLETVLGWVLFGGLRLAVAPGVFVPRRRTELVARLASAELPQGGTLADLCCGVGAIAAVVAHERPDARVIAADFDPRAVAVAVRNLEPYGATALVSDMDSSISVPVDVITACPPYVPTGEIPFMPSEARDFEPHTALDGGADGTALQAAVFAAAARRLSPGGVAIVETSASLAELTAQRAVEAGLNPTVGHDEDLGATVVVARRA
jgi:release factor glutamine methyltransferase